MKIFLGFAVGTVAILGTSLLLARFLGYSTLLAYSELTSIVAAMTTAFSLISVIAIDHNPLMVSDDTPENDPSLQDRLRGHIQASPYAWGTLFSSATMAVVSYLISKHLLSAPV